MASTKISVQGRPVGQWLSPGASAKEGGITSKAVEGEEAQEALLEWFFKKGGEVSG